MAERNRGNTITRRRFIYLPVTSAGVALLAACGERTYPPQGAAVDENSSDFRVQKVPPLPSQSPFKSEEIEDIDTRADFIPGRTEPNTEFDSPKEEVRKYGEFALGNRGFLTVPFIVDFLAQNKAVYPDYTNLAEFMHLWEEQYGIGAEYVLTLAWQETTLGQQIGIPEAPNTNINNWLNWGTQDQNNRFPSMPSVEYNLEIGGFEQLHRYHRVWGVEPKSPNVKAEDWKPRHTFRQAMHVFAPKWENPNIESRIVEGENMIRRLRVEAKK